MKKIPLFVAVAAASAIATVQAQSIYGLADGGSTLARLASNGSLLGSSPITGLNPLDSLIDIDFFSSKDLNLYGLGTSGTLYTINPITGVALPNVANAGLAGGTAIDFNPAADRLRVFGGLNNFRITPGTGVVSSDGTLAYLGTDINAGAIPAVVAAAYSNNIDNPGSTTLFSLDTALNTLVRHSGGPQFSTMNTVIGLTLAGNPFDIGSSVGFDIFTTGGLVNTAYVSNGNDLYNLNLASGGLTLLGTVPSRLELSDIAIAPVPEAGTWMAGAFGVLLALSTLGRRLIKT